jgi:hypothetical protein
LAETGALLTGYRGSPALDVAALAALIRRLSAVLLAEPAIAEMDLNPVILHPKGRARWLDALMMLRWLQQQRPPFLPP